MKGFKHKSWQLQNTEEVYTEANMSAMDLYAITK